MNESPVPPIDEASLHALVDGRLSPDEREALLTRLVDAPEAARTAQAWQAQRDLLRALHQDVLREPVPPAIAEAARGIGRAGARIDRWQRWGGMAAAVLLAFGTGWLANGRWNAAPGPAALAKARGADFGHQAVAAHVVYSPEVRHPVEVPAAQQEHLVQWLSKRLGRPLKVPDLAAQGYELVGGRLLPGDQGARAQFMYQNGRGERVTLYVGALDAGKAVAAMPAGETAFRFTSEAGASSFYWVDQGFGYALAGRLERADLLRLSEAVYRQL
jgi:anti-sigma factor RsiW